MFDPKEDGITHINIYSKSLTLLGRFLSNFYSLEINTLLGKFQSIEGLIYYMGSFNENLRQISGHNAKSAGQLYDRGIRLPEDVFKRIIIDAMWKKIVADPAMAKELRDSTLPLTHYYSYDKKVVQVGPKWACQTEAWESIRKDLQNGKFRSKPYQKP